MNLRKATPFSEAFKGKIMPANKLPTFIDVTCYYYFVFDANDHGANISINKTVSKIEEIWKSASLPIIITKHIRQKLLKHLDVLTKLKKSQHSPKYFPAAVKKHFDKYSTLFDVCSCRCHNKKCDCKLINRIPAAEIEFIRDQRNERKLVIEPTKTKTTKRSRFTASSCVLEKKRAEVSGANNENDHPDAIEWDDNIISSSDFDSDHGSPDFEPEKSAYVSILSLIN